MAINPAPSQKHLGIILDQELRFNEHAAYAQAKGLKWVSQFGRLARPKRGMPHGYARQLYNAVCIPRMLYAADVFCHPVVQIKDGEVRVKPSPHVKKLERVQRQAAIAITGAMRTTAGDVLNAHANLLPTHLAVEKICARAVVRMATHPKSHPLHSHIAKAARSFPSHRSPLHHLFHAFEITPKKTEKINHYRRSPVETTHPRFKTYIAKTKEEAIEDEESCRDRHKFYTDGSGYKGAIGAAAVMTELEQQEGALRIRLGTVEEHTVYEGEAIGILLALHMASKQCNLQRFTIFTDNQAAIRATTNSAASNGHHIFDEIDKAIRRILSSHPRAQATIRWIPGHADVEGNEWVDREAKRAAEGQQSDKKEVPRYLRKTLPLSASAQRQRLMASIKEKAKQVWKKSPRYAKMSKIDATLPSKRYSKNIATLSRQQASLLTQLRTGHIGLNHHLFRINRAESPLCPACESARETVLHFLIECPAHRKARAPFHRSLHPRALTLTSLLGNKTHWPMVFRFVHNTGRLAGTFDDITSPPARSQAGQQPENPNQ